MLDTMANMDINDFREHVQAIPRLKVFLQNGRVKRWPRKAALRNQLLDIVIACLGETQIWNEAEITRTLSEIASDPATLRRTLVDTKRLVRSPDGSIYRLPPSDGAMR